MTEVRDWQKDMEMCKALEGEEWRAHGDGLFLYQRGGYMSTYWDEEHVQVVNEHRSALTYWLQQYAKMKDSKQTYRKVAQKYTRKYRAEKERADKAGEREQHLKEEIARAMRYIDKEAFRTAYNLLESVLYPLDKEEDI